MNTAQLQAHEPYAHKDHTDDIPCGCAGGDLFRTGIPITVCVCGAAYLWNEVVVFALGIFKCYDCHRVCMGRKL